MVADQCYECDRPHPLGKPHMYRVPCPAGRPGCCTAHYGPRDPKALSTLSARVVEAAVGYVAAETADPTSWPGGPDAWIAGQNAAWAELRAAVDALIAAREGR